MEFKLSALGHELNLNTVKKVIKSSFKNIKYEAEYSFHSLYEHSNIISAIKDAEEKSDVLLFTGKLIYEMALYLSSPKKPWYYIEHGQTDLLKYLMEATLGKGIRIERICSDAFNYKELKAICDEIGIDAKIDKSLLIDYKYEEHFHQKIINSYKDNYKLGKSDISMTYLSDVYEALCKNKIPCIHIKPSPKAIFDTLNIIVVDYENSQKNISNIVIISIEINKISEFSNLYNKEYEQFFEKSEIAKHIYRFSRNVQGVVKEEGSKNFCIFTTKQIIEQNTQHFKNLQLLNDISLNTQTNVSIGIGYGSSVRKAHQNSILALNEAQKLDGSQAFIYYTEDSFIGPLTPSINEHKRFIDDTFYRISQESQIGIQIITSLYTLIKDREKNRFITVELAEYLDTTVRNTNRIIGKLENAGYANIVGKVMTSTSGRPSRVIELNFI